MFIFSGPAEVRGFFQKIREVLQPVLILIFLLPPWIKINGEPMLLCDFFNRHFVVFGVRFFSHDAPLLFFLLIILILLIFTVTAVFGRLWCGWTCPQTVFLHAVFNKLEKLILGPYVKRKLLFLAEDSWPKKMRVSLVYIVFFAASWVLAHSAVAYFIGADTVTRYVFEGPARHLEAFFILSSATIALFLNFTFFRENLCIVVCPYGRFQNALIDSNSLVVFYDQLRGEPRGKLSSASLQPEKGDCIDCRMCVNVCPTKIDIRSGFQLECIACGKCIDACNDVMAKVKRQPNLIRFETGNQKKISLARFRLVLYAALLVVFIGGFFWTLAGRNTVDFSLNRSHSAAFGQRTESGKKILFNQIELHIQNQTENNLQIALELSESNRRDGFRLSTPALQLELHKRQDIKIPAFIEIDENNYLPENSRLEIGLKSEKSLLKKQIQFMRVQ